MVTPRSIMKQNSKGLKQSKSVDIRAKKDKKSKSKDKKDKKSKKSKSKDVVALTDIKLVGLGDIEAEDQTNKSG